ncbi:hypothetical protein [Bailinhaonella thermotolerans]|uniref:DivIVA domain-containing protein n=1 Tax=Bailinhaonella thermotolerans TaxID=1070861 RepID=A0A3A4B7H3_9ACTN|nr:hypothetical protein [Bailinhaonella thermotolerans]RJL33444.1 hypothetical protein D5H75_11700 [Bailinhaonella thermotolerans]
MLVVLLVAAVAVLVAVMYVSMGRGGEMAEFAPDIPPLDLPEPRSLTAVDLVALRLPVTVVGYNTRSVDDALQRVAMAVSERDTRIAVLEQRVAELTSWHADAGQAPTYPRGPATRFAEEPVLPEPAPEPRVAELPAEAQARAQAELDTDPHAVFRVGPGVPAAEPAEHPGAAPRPDARGTIPYRHHTPAAPAEEPSSGTAGAHPSPEPPGTADAGSDTDATAGPEASGTAPAASGPPVSAEHEPHPADPAHAARGRAEDAEPDAAPAPDQAPPARPGAAHEAPEAPEDPGTSGTPEASGTPDQGTHDRPGPVRAHDTRTDRARAQTGHGPAAGPGPGDTATEPARDTATPTGDAGRPGAAGPAAPISTDEGHGEPAQNAQAGPTRSAPAQAVPAQGAPSQGVPAQGAPAQGAPGRPGGERDAGAPGGPAPAAGGAWDPGARGGRPRTAAGEPGGDPRADAITDPRGMPATGGFGGNRRRADGSLQRGTYDRDPDIAIEETW